MNYCVSILFDTSIIVALLRVIKTSYQNAKEQKTKYKNPNTDMVVEDNALDVAVGEGDWAAGVGAEVDSRLVGAGGNEVGSWLGGVGAGVCAGVSG